MSKNATKKVLFILAHPDDETIFFGNCITKLSEDGNEVHVLSLTNGERGFVHQQLDDGRVVRYVRNNDENLGNKRNQEFYDACQSLGATKAWALGLPDGGVGAEHHTVLDTFVAELMPEEIYTFDPTGTSVHADHQACFFLSLHAAMAAPKTVRLYCPQKPAALVRSMDEWSRTNLEDKNNESEVITGNEQRILEAAAKYKDQSKLIGYFKRIGFLTASEELCAVEVKWQDYHSVTEFSEKRVEELYVRELGQYAELCSNVSRLKEITGDRYLH